MDDVAFEKSKHCLATIMDHGKTTLTAHTEKMSCDELRERPGLKERVSSFASISKALWTLAMSRWILLWAMG